MAARDDNDKDGGFLDGVASRLRLPFRTPEFIDKIVEGSVNEAGRRTLYMLIITWDQAGGGPFAASAIGSAGVSKTVDQLEKLFIGPLFEPLLKALGADDVKLRATLCASQLVGLGVLRYAVRSEPIASMEVGHVVDAIGPTLQRYLVGDLGRADD